MQVRQSRARAAAAAQRAAESSELWADGAGFANRSEWAGEGLTFTCCRVVAPRDVRPAAADVDQL
eukprot:976504-Prymnesium_polylepis.1